MKPLKRFFLSRLLREKILLLFLVGLAAAIWLSAVMGRARAFGGEVQRTSADLGEQRQWLNEQAAIEEEARRSVERFDPSRTFNGTALIGEISALTREAKISNPEINNPRTERTDYFATHTVEVTLRRVDWEGFRRFYEALGKRTPYIGLEQFGLRSETANPHQLNARLRIVSFEIAR